MFDFHTHVLPEMDDGSSGVEESLSMLRKLKEQGVTGVAATPHFYGDRTSPEDFFAQRSLAWERLRPHLAPDLPKIRLGAEVRYFEGINRYEELSRFCLEGTDLLLLEMPHGPWTTRMAAALEDLSRREDITLLLAHVERYFRRQKKAVWDRLLNLGVLMQASADYFTGCTRRQAVSLLRRGHIHLLGTDCHNDTTRSPNMDAAVAAIRRKNGEDLLEKIMLRECTVLQKNIAQSQKLDYTVD